MAGYVIYRYKLNQFSRIIVLVLILLGMFQLSEYVMCTGTDVMLWARIGAASITILPVLCVHLVTMITRKSRWTQLGYLIGGVIVTLILFTPVLKSIGCTGNYVEVNFHDWFSILFNVYYGLFLFIGIEMLVRTWITNKGDSKALFWAFATYMAFLIPTAIVYIIYATTRNGTPSIMCGFAVFGAVVFVFKEVPRFYQIQATKSKRKKK
jgi:hypothetical protein